MPFLLSLVEKTSANLPSCPDSPQPHVYTEPFWPNINKWWLPEATFVAEIPSNMCLGSFCKLFFSKKPNRPELS